MDGFYEFAESNYTVVRDILDPSTTNFDHYGKDDDGPRPQVETNNVVVPRSTIQLSVEEIQPLMDEIPPLSEDNGHGIYQRALAFVDNLIESEGESS